MQTRTIGIVITLVGAIMLLYNSFNYVTTEKIVDIGPIQINKEVNHPVKWSPIAGIVLVAGGIVLILKSNKQSK